MSDHTSKRRKLSPSPDAAPANPLNRTKFTDQKRNVTRGKDERSAELAMASGFYKSSFFKLQMDELLEGLRPNYTKQVSKAQEPLHQIKSAIEDLSDKTPQSVSDAEKELRASGLVIPWPEPRPSKEAKYSMAYAKPANINVVGSFALKTGARSLESRPIDLAVTMPNSLFQEKDYVNFRYFHKRAYYIACLAAGIQDTVNNLGFDLKFSTQDGDSLRPLILLEPRDSNLSQIRILTTIDPTFFPITRTLPMKSNIRQASANSEMGEPTSFYNASLRADATVSLYHKSIYLASQKCESFKDACILGRTWLHQRGFHTSFQNGGFGGFEWTVLLSLLFEGGGPAGQPVLLPSYSCYQIFKATIQFLAGRDLTTPLFVGHEVPVPSGVPVVFDGRRGLNILYKMTPWSYATLRHEASTTLKMLNESREDNFDQVFILKVDEPALRFDRWITIKSFTGETLRALQEQTNLYNVLSRALGDRVKLVSISSDPVHAWSVKSKQPKKSNEGVSVGLLLNAENVGRIVDHGPAAEEKEESASFQAFWGEKSELRRFKDGSILESLVWSEDSEESIIHQILEYILQRHFGIDEFDFLGDEYDEHLKEHGDNILSYSSPAFQSVNDAFKDLETSIRGMDEVPLEVRHLAPASSLLRYTAVRPSGPADIVLQFESSSRWPDDFAAIQMTKIAFLLKIGDALEQSGAASSSCRVGLENESSKIINNAYLDIPHSSGVLFRLRIHHDREQTLLERNLKDRNLSPREREEAAFALSCYKKTFVQIPRLTQALRSLCTRFPLLSPTIRLTKQWFNSHMFTAQISDELVELLVIRTFTQPNPWECPSSVMTGFLRTLHSLSRWDWQQEPFIVDLGGDLTPEVTENIRTRFTAWRNIDPAMNNLALFVASDLDMEGVTWTQYEMPSKVVAGRMSSLATAAVSLVRTNSHNLDITDLFDTSLAPYDFVIHLRSKLFSASTSVPKFKNLAEPRASMGPTIKSFVCDVHTCYNQSILLFHGDDRCPVIAGLWNPQTLKPRSWNLKTAYSTAPASGSKDQVSINRTAILNEIARLGHGLVESIEVHGNAE
jgi:U3 small nucleolar RNA-associated protein 22